MSEIKVNSIKGVGASTAAITVNNTDGTCTANLTNRTKKNLVINGACLVSQRATSSTDNGYGTVDRFKVSYSGHVPTQAQVDIASGTTPYELGFRKSLKITNNNSSGVANSGNFTTYAYRIEAQDMAGSGWNYTSTSSFITLSFYIKSSVAQSFGGFLRSHDGTQLSYPFVTGSLSADTWTKITKTIPGNSSMSFNNDTGTGLEIIIGGYWGTDYTESGKNLNAWSNYTNASRLRDFPASTWYTTNGATLELTGLQVEVSDHATDFEHRSFGQELALCQRYFQKISSDPLFMQIIRTSDNQHRLILNHIVTMRAAPTGTIVTSSADGGGTISVNSASTTTIQIGQGSANQYVAPNVSVYTVDAEI